MKRLALFLLAFVASSAFGVPLSTIGSFCGLFPDQCMKGTMSLLSARGTGTNAYYVMEVDPATGSIPVTTTVTFNSEGTPGAAAPSKALQVGGTDGTNLRAIKTDTAGDQVIIGLGTAGTPAGGVVSVQGVASGTVLPANVSQFGGSAVATGTGTGGSGIPRVTVSSDSTIGLVAGSAIIGTVMIDQTVPGITNAVKATNFPTTVDTSTGTAGASTIRTVLAARSEASATPLAVRQGNGTSFVTMGTGPDDTATPRTTLSNRSEAASTPLSVRHSNGTSFDSYNTGAASSTTPRVVLALDSPSPQGRIYADSVRYAYSSGAVGTVSWVQLIASTADTINCIQVFDSSGQTLELGVGGAGVEARVLIIPPGGLDGCVPLYIPSVRRISIRALSATTGAVGEIDLTGLN